MFHNAERFGKFKSIAIKPVSVGYCNLRDKTQIGTFKRDCKPLVLVVKLRSDVFIDYVSPCTSIELFDLPVEVLFLFRVGDYCVDEISFPFGGQHPPRGVGLRQTVRRSSCPKGVS